MTFSLSLFTLSTMTFSLSLDIIVPEIRQRRFYEGSSTLWYGLSGLWPSTRQVRQKTYEACSGRTLKFCPQILAPPLFTGSPRLCRPYGFHPYLPLPWSAL